MHSFNMYNKFSKLVFKLNNENPISKDQKAYQCIKDQNLQGCWEVKIIEFFQSKVHNQIDQGQIRACKCSLTSRRQKDSNDRRVTSR